MKQILSGSSLIFKFFLHMTHSPGVSTVKDWNERFNIYYLYTMKISVLFCDSYPPRVQGGHGHTQPSTTWVYHPNPHKLS